MANTEFRGLLAAVVPRFVPKIENLATASLAYLLGESEHVEHEFRKLVERITGVWVEEPLCWRTQQGSQGGAIPDVVGFDTANRERVIVEGKFWADLTENQPGAYLDQLKSLKTAGVLLFVGPDKRGAFLWQEIRKACIGYDLGSDTTSPKDTYCAPVLGNHKMALVSWRAVIAALLTRAQAMGEPEMVTNLAQLLSLANGQDDEAFLPLHTADFSDRIPTRILQYRDLVALTVLKLTSENSKPLPSLCKLKATGGHQGWFGEWISIRPPLIGLLYFSAVKWKSEGLTPIWFQLTGKTGRCPPKVRERLASLNPPLKIVENKGDDWGPTIPILLPTRVDRDEVVRQMVEQITRVITVVIDRDESTVDRETAGTEGGVPADEIPGLPADEAPPTGSGS